MISYLFKVCLFQGAFALVYYFLLRNLTFFRVNRTYLITAITGSFLLPLFQFSFTFNLIESTALTEVVTTSRYLDFEVWNRINAPSEGHPFSLIKASLYIYTIGCLLFVCRFLINLFRINQLKYAYELIQKTSEVSVFRTPSSQPFSFFNQVFIPDQISEEEYKKVMAHEMQHVRQKHSYDRLLIDFIIALLWINPFIYLFKKWLIEVHEFEADEAVIQDHGDKFRYQLTLLEFANQPLQSGPVSFFNFSIIKRRIKMMNQKKSRSTSVFRLFIVVPVITSMCLLFSFHPRVFHIENISFGGSNDIWSLLDIQESDNVPSVFPVKADENTKVRISSGYGIRVHPIEKVEKMHRGIDIATAKGTPVIATANGTVESVEYQPKGYGKFIIITHKEGYKSKYAQLDSYSVKVGDAVKKGEIIGTVGSSGKSTAPHLHYEIIKDDEPVDPADYILDFKPE